MDPEQRDKVQEPGPGPRAPGAALGAQVHQVGHGVEDGVVVQSVVVVRQVRVVRAVVREMHGVRHRDRAGPRRRREAVQRGQSRGAAPGAQQQRGGARGGRPVVVGVRGPGRSLVVVRAARETLVAAVHRRPQRVVVRAVRVLVVLSAPQTQQRQTQRRVQPQKKNNELLLQTRL